MKAYIISFYQQEISDNELVAFLDTKREVLNWQSVLPNTVFIVSNKNATFLARQIDKKFPQSHFIIAEYTSYNADGLLPEEMWDFLNNPEAADQQV